MNVDVVIRVGSWNTGPENHARESMCQWKRLHSMIWIKYWISKPLHVLNTGRTNISAKLLTPISSFMCTFMNIGEVRKYALSFVYSDFLKYTIIILCVWEKVEWPRNRNQTICQIDEITWLTKKLEFGKVSCADIQSDWSLNSLLQ